MKCLHAKRASVTAAIRAALFIAIALSISIAAQNTKSPSTRTPSGGMSPEARDRYLREMSLKSLELEKSAKSGITGTPSNEIIKQVKEDFLRIQDINEGIIRDYVAGEPPNYKHISEAMEEIRKRAARLNDNLLLPADLENSQKSLEAGKGNARSPLLDLNDLIKSFVSNPIFKNSNTIDAKTGAKAKKDLQGIVALSGRISKSADKLSKSQSKSN